MGKTNELVCGLIEYGFNPKVSKETEKNVILSIKDKCSVKFCISYSGNIVEYSINDGAFFKTGSFHFVSYEETSKTIYSVLKRWENLWRLSKSVSKNLDGKFSAAPVYSDTGDWLKVTISLNHMFGGSELKKPWNFSTKVSVSEETQEKDVLPYIVDEFNAWERLKD